MDHDKFWQLSWFEWSLYARRNKIRIRELQAIDYSHWERFRIQWADFRNAHTSKGKSVKPQDLIKLPIDDYIKNKKAAVTPNLEAIKKRFGSKVKNRKKNGK